MDTQKIAKALNANHVDILRGITTLEDCDTDDLTSLFRLFGYNRPLPRQVKRLYEKRIKPFVEEVLRYDNNDEMAVNSDEMAVNSDEMAVNNDEMAVNNDEMAVNNDEMAKDAEPQTLPDADTVPVAAGNGPVRSAALLHGPEEHCDPEHCNPGQGPVCIVYLRALLEKAETQSKAASLDSSKDGFTQKLYVTRATLPFVKKALEECLEVCPWMEIDQLLIKLSHGEEMPDLSLLPEFKFVTFEFPDEGTREADCTAAVANKGADPVSVRSV